MPKPEKGTVSSPPVGPAALLVRLGWMLFGTGVLVFSAIFIARHDGSLSVADGVLWGDVAACIVLRYIDITRLNGRTATLEPATLKHWRRYSALLVAVGLVVWGVAHAVARFSR